MEIVVVDRGGYCVLLRDPLCRSWFFVGGVRAVDIGTDERGNYIEIVTEVPADVFAMVANE